MIVLVSVSNDIRDALSRANVAVVESRSGERIDIEEPPSESIDAVVLGPAVPNPVQGASLAYRIDAAASVIILAHDPEQCARIRSALRFAPLIGRDVGCTHGTAEAAVEAIRQAATRARSRRSHRQTLQAMSAQLDHARATGEPLHERYLAQLMEVAPIGIVVTDGDLRVASANVEAARILGASEREMVGLVLGGDALGEDDGAWAQLLGHATSVPGELSKIERVRNGRLCTLEARAVRVEDTRSRGYIVILQDVTQRARLERQRHEALQRAEEASRLKDAFLATVSHELRTPLSSVLGWARLLRSGVAQDKTDKALETIERNALVQSQLIEDLLDITRITTGKLRLEVERTELWPVIEAAIESVLPSVEAKQLQLTRMLGSVADSVLGDPSRLQQVFWNLLSNAVKFAAKGAGHIHVVMQRVESHLEILVRDNGQGISAEFLPHVFDSFRQADGSATRRHGGLGLGLAISKHLVELHGGTIHAFSAGEGQGATFTVRLPIAPLRAMPHRPPPRDRHVDVSATLDSPLELRDLRVLVVEDEEDSRELVGDIMRRCGAAVCLAAGVAEAMRELEAFVPDVLLSDIGMPDEDGYSLIAKIRARPHEQGGNIPAAALTAYAHAEDRRRALNAGFQMHVVKPVDPAELISVVATLARMGKLIHASR